MPPGQSHFAAMQFRWSGELAPVGFRVVGSQTCQLKGRFYHSRKYDLSTVNGAKCFQPVAQVSSLTKALAGKQGYPSLRWNTIPVTVTSLSKQDN
ncbi:hypothetical protein NPIL_495621 [Nephila pilipes]|uniref:Uncharacterized protein n=1 Tax=Nephila pilipes TaxID=299642 RepID=A0A8X6M9T4_NEPPI|nr:hypothetical protein NPIL_495621 [Nephila pilipes]